MSSPLKLPLNASLNSEKTQATFDIESGQIFATAGQLENAILELSNLRAQMTPEVSQEIDVGRLYHIGPYRLIHQPNSEGNSPVEVGAFLLGLCPGLGWVQLYLSNESCRNLYHWLSSAYEHPPNQKH